jgi:hypothetical protein
MDEADRPTLGRGPDQKADIGNTLCAVRQVPRADIPESRGRPGKAGIGNASRDVRKGPANTE